ncbi:MFS transporter (plasmid) [Lichenicola cladoniae]|uniref:MFS transporter n=2 Tax=Lichenicola cladoniae TaxID=1484109 RepID=A0A6M8HY32_9PROT|nr:MFS transporter [Acetobacteraceae bacterium]QKE93258.1 MFS transporter [Lichenicola cladoniae]
MSVELNDAVSSALLGDISGGLGFTHDPGTWFSSLYLTAEVFGMSVSPWFLLTLSIRRWGLLVIALTCISTVAIPWTSNLTVLYALRILQGMSEGLTIPLVFTIALRALGPPIRLFGLAAYSMTATMFPSLAAGFAALWEGAGDATLGWQFAFWQAIPIGAVAASLLWYGMPQDPPKYERFRIIDWRGMLLSLIGFGSLTTMLQQGDRLDWFNSDLICILALVSVATIPLFVWNEWCHEAPLMRIQLLTRRNFAYGLVALFTFIVVSGAGSTLPTEYLQEVQSFRPLQSFALTGGIALTQLVFLPLVAVLLNFERVDPRVVHFLGLGLLLGACIGDSLLTSVWMGGEFYLWQLTISASEAMVVMSLLQLATNTIKPPEGPYASALVNTPRALGEATSVWLFQLIERWRGGLHSSRLTDQAGQERYTTVYAQGLLPSGLPRPGGGLAALNETIRLQGTVLTLSDAFLVMAAITAALMVVMLILPVRTYPPRIALLQQ